jgi:hypothetical protein
MVVQARLFLIVPQAKGIALIELQQGIYWHSLSRCYHFAVDLPLRLNLFPFILRFGGRRRVLEQRSGFDNLQHGGSVISCRFYPIANVTLWRKVRQENDSGTLACAVQGGRYHFGVHHSRRIVVPQYRNPLALHVLDHFSGKLAVASAVKGGSAKPPLVHYVGLLLPLGENDSLCFDNGGEIVKDRLPTPAALPVAVVEPKLLAGLAPWFYPLLPIGKVAVFIVVEVFPRDSLPQTGSPA